MYIDLCQLLCSDRSDLETGKTDNRTAKSDSATFINVAKLSRCERQSWGGGFMISRRSTDISLPSDKTGSVTPVLSATHCDCSHLLNHRLTRDCVLRSTQGRPNALDRVHKRAPKFTNNTKNSVWETLAQRGKTAVTCVLFKAYTGERASNATGDWL